ncbi:fimbrial assembly family protein [Acidovorax sp. KKS102]|uniref:PilN domain-containing protein n=1 Tax=Acidovorax sp. KKS102 TaxID=358220 RepID=UPI00028A57E6|nr:PilN domain-containing protein [Acidovorax sp. KKS102]AFU44577.1 fimbrial assembly family protein [Acidovorax sp. KKS102]
MILINLLPHREEARKRRKEAFQATMFASFLLGLAIAGAIYWWFQIMIADQQNQNAFLQQEIKVLEGQIKEIASIEDEIASLRARQKAVEDLQSDRNLPVHLLTEMVKQLPEGVYVTAIKQVGQTITMQGLAQSNERVSELLRNLANNTPWLAKPELAEITASTLALSQRDQRRVSSFNLRFQLVRASDAQKAIEAANGTASPPKGK